MGTQLKATLNLRYGAVSPLIAGQLKEQGFVVDHQHNLESWQKCADAITLLFLHGYLTDAEKLKCRKRLHKAITEHIIR